MKRANLNRLFKDSVHGGALKVLALLARLAFLVLVVPNLLEGELATYVFVSSAGLLVATLGILGLNEDLPRVIEGDAAKAQPFLWWFYVIQFAFVLSIILLVSAPGTVSACLALTTALLSARYISGLVRSVDMRIAERLMNVPWILFFSASMLFGLNQGFDLILTMALSLAAVQWYAFVDLRRRLSRRENSSHISFVELLRHGLRHGVSRLLSALCLLGFARGFVLWPVWFSLDYDIDGIAFAITAGEVVFQLGMVPVHRAYARWCRSKEFSRHQVRTAVTDGAILFVSLSILASLGVFMLGWLGLMPPQVDSLPILLQAIFVAALLPALHLLRFLLLAQNLLLIWIVNLTFLMFLSTAVISAFVPINYWFAAAGIIVLIACVIIALKAGSLQSTMQKD